MRKHCSLSSLSLGITKIFAASIRLSRYLLSCLEDILMLIFMPDAILACR